MPPPFVPRWPAQRSPLIWTAAAAEAQSRCSSTRRRKKAVAWRARGGRERLGGSRRPTLVVRPTCRQVGVLVGPGEFPVGAWKDQSTLNLGHVPKDKKRPSPTDFSGPDKVWRKADFVVSLVQLRHLFSIFLHS